MPDALLSLRGVTVEYRSGRRLWQGRSERFRPLSDVSLGVARGQSLGVIGRNGSGKTTLLKVLAGVLRPTLGEVARHTDSISLLSLGVGYDPYISANNNAMLNGLLLGLSKREMEARLDDIFDYAELNAFRHKRLKTYSSGMIARLAFATGLHVDSELLLIDEVLSVGDQDFRAKSEASMKLRLRDGRTFVLVTHLLGVVTELCDVALWIERGRVVRYGPAREVVDAYRESGPA